MGEDARARRMGRSVERQEAMSRVIANALCWRAERQSVHDTATGPEVIRPMDLIPYIEAYQQRPDPWFAVIVWGTWHGDRAVVSSETVIKKPHQRVIHCIPPTQPEDQIRDYAAHLADYLATELQQVRVYVAVYPIRSLIVDTSEQVPSMSYRRAASARQTLVA